MSKRVFRIMLILQLLFSICTLQTLAVSTSAVSAILVDAGSGDVLYEQNADAKMLIASTTKIMTALVAIREGNLSDTVTVSKAAAYTEGSAMYLGIGEELTLETLLYGLMLCSGNDAAVAVAEHVGGSVEGFVAMMNETAEEIGLTSTSFANPNGLDHESHYSTAGDMAILACAAMENETLARIVSTKSITIGGRTMTNHNKLLSYMDGCTGLKTGYTRAAGRTLVSCAEKDGQRLVAVTLQDGNDWADHQALYEYGFSNWAAQCCAAAGQIMQACTVVNGTAKTVPLVAAETLFWPVGPDETLTTKINVTTPLAAPLRAGREVGEAIFFLNGTEIGRVSLLCGADVLPRVAPAMAILKTGLPG